MDMVTNELFIPPSFGKKLQKQQMNEDSYTCDFIIEIDGRTLHHKVEGSSSELILDSVTKSTLLL